MCVGVLRAPCFGYVLTSHTPARAPTFDIALLSTTTPPQQQQHGQTTNNSFVPANMIYREGSLDLHIWCHGAINRSAAEFMLVRNDQPGSFLVRESQSSKGDYTLSIYDGKVAHYRINEKPKGNFFIRTNRTHDVFLCFGKLRMLIGLHPVATHH